MARALAAALLLAACAAATAGPRDFRPGSDAEVVETLAPRVRTASLGDPAAAALAARQAIALARQTADPRHLGRAQAVLGPWWDRPDAPAELAVLQATVQQARHEFDAAHATLNRALASDPSQAQAWLTLATLERVAARYGQAMAACLKVGGLHGQACQLETSSLLGQHDEARRGLQALQRDAQDPSTRAWLLSLLAESEERAGRDDAALTAYRASLALAPDTYTALAAADLLLRMRRPDQALALLEPQPASDAVLLRRAQARKLAGDAGWTRLAAELDARFAELAARGDPPAAHAREHALASLWLKEDGRRALASAQLNLGLQKEPLDWWLAAASATAAGDAAEAARLRDAAAATGLRDARLAATKEVR